MNKEANAQRINAAKKLLEKAGYSIEAPVAPLSIGDIVHSVEDEQTFIITMTDPNGGDYTHGGVAVGSNVYQDLLWVCNITYKQNKSAYKILGHINLSKAEQLCKP